MSFEQDNDAEFLKGSKRSVQTVGANRSGVGRGKFRNRGRTSAETGHTTLEDQTNVQTLEESSPVFQSFRSYQVLLDAKHDKYERLVKKSRDVTIESKRVIFLLHRISSDSDISLILEEADEKLGQIRKTSLHAIALELENEDIFQYIRAFAPGLQEYVEAVTFYQYMKNEKIAPLSDIENNLKFDNEGSVVHLQVPPVDYILGLADLSGELMRRGINCVGQGNLQVPFQLSLVLKSLYEGFNSLGMAGREISRKTRVLKQSLEKVEWACYNINVRGSEIPKHMLTDVFSNQQSSPSREHPEEAF